MGRQRESAVLALLRFYHYCVSCYQACAGGFRIAAAVIVAGRNIAVPAVIRASISIAILIACTAPVIIALVIITAGFILAAGGICGIGFLVILYSQGLPSARGREAALRLQG